MSDAGPLWSGRLAGGLDPRVLAFSASLVVDRRCCRTTSARRRRTSACSARQGIVPAADAEAIAAALDDVAVDDGRERRGRPLADRAPARRPPRRDRQARPRRPLAQRPGGDGVPPLGRRRRADLVGAGRRPAGRAGGAGADADGDLVLPGYTHLQRAQPVPLGHHLAPTRGRCERDVERLRAADAAADVLARWARARWPARAFRSTRTVSRRSSASPAEFANSLDAVSDRDFAVRPRLRVRPRPPCTCRGWREELVLWTSQEFGFAELDDAVATGLEHDAAEEEPATWRELVRGRAGVAIGRLTALLGELKGLPLAYNRDLQEDKEPVFAQVDGVRRGARRAGARVRRAPLRRGAHGRRGRRRPDGGDRRRRGAGARGRAVPRGARAGRVAASPPASASPSQRPPRRSRRAARRRHAGTLRASSSRRCERAIADADARAAA